jgi:hypothetical protein
MNLNESPLFLLLLHLHPWLCVFGVLYEQQATDSTPGPFLVALVGQLGSSAAVPDSRQQVVAGTFG